MKLSDCIRLGQSIRPRQIKGSFLDGEDGACGYGMALIGVGESPHITLKGFPSFFGAQIQKLVDIYPFLRMALLDCEFCTATGYDIAGMITHLNDSHRYTVDQLCAFVDKFDPEAIAERAQQPEACMACVEGIR